MAAIRSPLTNPYHITVWRKACTDAVKQNPGSQADLFLQLALNELHDMYVQGTAPNANPLQKRQDIYRYFKEAGQTGHARGMFFEGLALLGFGCKTDVITSQALLRVAAFARNCDLALQFLTLRLGHSHLAQPNLPKAIQCFQKAGVIATPELELIQNHIQQMRARYAQQAKLELEEAPRVVNVQSLRMTF